MVEKGEQIDLSIIENQILVSKNWFKYKDKIDIPNDMILEIKSLFKEYDDFMHTNIEVSNRILDLLNRHFTAGK